MIKILLSGDFCPINRSEIFIRNFNIHDAFNDLLPLIKDSDLAITNLECPLINSGNSIEKTGPHLKSSPDVAAFLRETGFGLVTLANNHIMDYGVGGLGSTITACTEAGLNYVGVGSNLGEARSIYYHNLSGVKIAVINACENEWSTTLGDIPGANPLNTITLYYDILEAKSNATYVFVILHGGNELYNLPSPRMKELCRFLVNTGANAVFCHHSHFLSGYEEYRGGLIFYGLGNLLFDNPRYRNQQWNIGLVIQLSIGNGKIKFDVIPITQSNEDSGVRIVEGIEKQRIIESLDDLNKKVLDDTALRTEFSDFCSKKSTSDVYRGYLQPYSNRVLIALFKKGIVPSLLSRSKIRLFHNLIRCESHRDVLNQILHT